MGVLSLRAVGISRRVVWGAAGPRPEAVGVTIAPATPMRTVRPAT